MKRGIIDVVSPVMISYRRVRPAFRKRTAQLCYAEERYSSLNTRRVEFLLENKSRKNGRSRRTKGEGDGRWIINTLRATCFFKRLRYLFEREMLFSLSFVLAVCTRVLRQFRETRVRSFTWNPPIPGEMSRISRIFGARFGNFFLEGDWRGIALNFWLKFRRKLKSWSYG